MSALAGRLGGYVQAYTLYSSVRPFGVSAIMGGWDAEEELPVDGQVGEGPTSGAGGKNHEGLRRGGPGLYMIEPSGLYWVHSFQGRALKSHTDNSDRATTELQQAKVVNPQRANSRSSI